jgi:hypothetical protein
VLSADLSPVQYVVVRQDGRLEWEPGDNRRIHVPLPGLAAALAEARKVAALEAAAGVDGSSSRKLITADGRKLSPAEVYELQESEEQLEPWQVKQQEEQQQQQQQQQQQYAVAASNGSLAPGSFSAAAVVPQGGGVGAAAAAVDTKGWREVKITTKFSAQFGTFIKAVGGPDELGAWDVVAAPPLQWSEGDVWSNTLLLPPGGYEFKVGDSSLSQHHHGCYDGRW